MIINELKEYKKLVEKYNHYTGLYKTCAFNLNRYKQFCAFAQKDVLVRQSLYEGIKTKLNMTNQKSIAMNDELATSKDKLHEKRYIFDEYVIKYQFIKNVTPNVLEALNKTYKEVKALYEKITNKTSYKILCKINKKVKINEVFEPEETEYNNKFNEHDYNLYTNKFLFNEEEKNEDLIKEFGNNMAFSQTDFDCYMNDDVDYNQDNEEEDNELTSKQNS